MRTGKADSLVTAARRATTKELIKELSKRGAVFGIVVDDKLAINGSGCCLLTLLCNVASSVVDDLPEGSDGEQILLKFVNDMVTAFGGSAGATDERPCEEWDDDN